MLLELFIMKKGIYNKEECIFEIFKYYLIK